MIKIPTTMILGAGASTHVGYPLGQTLINDLCRDRAGLLARSYPPIWTSDTIDKFLNRLSRSGHYSIDAFLETLPSEADLGKYLLAAEMKRHEHLDRLFPPNDSGWYQYLFNSLLIDSGRPGFSESNLSIITFNYDRSVEVYLHEALMARFEMTQDEASATLSEIPIVHVHGSLGDYPDTKYEPSDTVDDLLAISQQISIIHEVKDNKDGFASPEFERAHELLQGSEHIFILGFGFHPDNVRRLRFFDPSTMANRSVRATASGFGGSALTSLVERLSPLGFERRMFDGNTCNEFFKQAASLA